MHSGASRRIPLQLVVRGRYELYSNYAFKIQAVAASIPQRDDVVRLPDRS